MFCFPPPWQPPSRQAPTPINVTTIDAFMLGTMFELETGVKLAPPHLRCGCD
jgi:hypothetical protein